ncbi:hypothetical protein BC832DRAFT_109309 [Gaertneriomyces semiglobifer]|nr:hypothetical protein BC832DRAFT_109309 [Gaertneriomyces semiglobifer]
MGKRKTKATAESEGGTTPVGGSEIPGLGLSSIVIPGDEVSLEIPTSGSTKKVQLGPGLQRENGKTVAVKTGVLRTSPRGSLVDGSQRRYVPAVSDSVIGVITSKGSDYYKVDIGSAQPALLGTLAFEGATKKTKPNLDVGTLVYARVSVANKDMDPELECIHPSTGRASGYGELKGGFLVKCSLGLARRLLSPHSPILTRLADSFSFEVSIGMNGRVWINATSPIQVITVAKAIQVADGAKASTVPKKVDLVLSAMEQALEMS